MWQLQPSSKPTLAGKYSVLSSQPNKEDKMTNDKDSSTHDHRGWKGMRDNGASSAVYGMAFIGALLYFIQHATSFWGGVLGILKAIIWPAWLIYKLLEFLKL
jgi:hypothetical protein